MNILIPIAGLGSRFLNEAHRNPEYAKPKPLIKIKGKIMMEWALSSFPITEEDQIIFIVRQEHIDQFQIDSELKKVFGENVKFIVIDYVTEGMACTALLAKEYINNDTPLFITDADEFIDGKKVFDEIKKQGNKIDGAIPVFYANNQKWSYSRVGEDGFVEETAEKKQISRTAHIGSYYFSKGRDFVWAAEEMIAEDDRTNNEFFIAPAYNYMIRRGKNIVVIRPKFAHGLGVPKDVEKFIWFLELGEVKHNFGNLDNVEVPSQDSFSIDNQENSPNSY